MTPLRLVPRPPDVAVSAWIKDREAYAEVRRRVTAYRQERAKQETRKAIWQTVKALLAWVGLSCLMLWMVTR